MEWDYGNDPLKAYEKNMEGEGSFWEEVGGRLLEGLSVLSPYPLQSLAQYGICRSSSRQTVTCKGYQRCFCARDRLNREPSRCDEITSGSVIAAVLGRGPGWVHVALYRLGRFKASFSDP